MPDWQELAGSFASSPWLYVILISVSLLDSFLPLIPSEPVACEIVVALQTLTTRAFDVFDPVVISVGMLQAGTKRNVIPDTARFEATIRSFSAQAKARLKASIPRLLGAIAEGHGLEATVDYIEEYPLTLNDGAESAFARHAGPRHDQRRLRPGHRNVRSHCRISRHADTHIMTLPYERVGQ